MKQYPLFVEEVINRLPEQERECAAEFMVWFDATHASQEMIKSDEIGWRKVEQNMYSGWRAAWNNEQPNKG